LKTDADPKYIRAIVVLSDGDDTVSFNGLNNVMVEIGDIGEEDGNAIKLFTSAYGDNASARTSANGRIDRGPAV